MNQLSTSAKITICIIAAAFIFVFSYLLAGGGQ